MIAAYSWGTASGPVDPSYTPSVKVLWAGVECSQHSLEAARVKLHAHYTTEGAALLMAAG